MTGKWVELIYAILPVIELIILGISMITLVIHFIVKVEESLLAVDIMK